MATNKKFYEVWAALTLALPWQGKERNDVEMKEAARLYQHMLADIDDDTLQAAAEKYIQTNKFFPTIAELRSIAAAISLPKRELALEAWGKVLAAQNEEWPGRYTRYHYTVRDGDAQIMDLGVIREENENSEPTFENPITQQVVQILGGWRSVIASSNQAAQRARFVELYDQLVEREHYEKQLTPDLRGETTSTNTNGLIGQMMRSLTKR